VQLQLVIAGSGFDPDKLAVYYILLTKLAWLTLSMRIKAYLYAVLALILFAFLLVGSPRPSREDWWRKDLRYLATELLVRHVNPFFSVTREEFDRAVDELDKAIPLMKDHEIVVGMKQIVAMIGDPHTDMAVEFSYYPLRLQWFKDGYFASATTSAYRRSLGSRLVQIGNMDVESAYAAIKTVISHDNENWLRKQSASFMVAPAILHAKKILPQMERGQFFFEDAKKNRFALDLARPTHKIDSSEWLLAPDEAKMPAPLYLKKKDVYYWFEHLQNSKTLYFQYNRCQEVETLPFGKFAEELFRSVDTLLVNRLIIDLRHNSGGNSGILWPFIVGLNNRPTINQKAHLFVIIGSGTYSSGVLNAAELQEHTHAIFFGEPTGARPNVYGEPRQFYLPNSGLAVSYSTKHFKRVKDDPPALMPDVTVELTAADYFAGRDPVLDRILTYQAK